jgi:hypothetical protein
MRLFIARWLLLLASTWSAMAQAGQEYGFWVDDKRVIGTLMSSSVEFGFDGYGRYVAAAGLRRYGPAGSDLGYQVNYGGSGRTQWLSFDFVGTNFFGNLWNTNSAIQGYAHLPIFMRAAQMDDGVAKYAAEGKGIFLGRNSVWGNCGAPWDKARIFFETKVINSAVAAIQRYWPPEQRTGDLGVTAVKCADGYADKFFEDGVTYRLTMHVNDTHMAYWLYKQDPSGNMVLWSANGTYALDYPATSFNSGFTQAMGQPWFGYDYGRMNNYNIDTLVLALVLVPLPDGIGTWNVKITNLNAGRF